MSSAETKLSLKEENYLGCRRPILDHRIEFSVPVDRDLEVHSETLWVFDGPSLKKFDVKTDVDSKLVWKDFGQFQLDKAQGIQPVIPHMAKTLLGPVGLGFVVDGVSVFQNFFQRYRGITQSSDLSWGLHLHSRLSKVPNVGTMELQASHFKKLRKQQQEIFQAHLDEIQGTPALLLCHQIKVTHDDIQRLLASNEKRAQKDKGHSLVLRETLNIDAFRPSNSRGEHGITALSNTSINGVSQIQKQQLLFAGPKYHEVQFAS